MNSFDLTIFHAINGYAMHHQTSMLSHMMEFIAKDALYLYAILFVIAWFALPKQEGQKRHGLVIAVFSGILALIINFIISHFIWFRQRPFMSLPKGTFVQLIPHTADASFPSDHGSGSSAFAFGSWGNAKWISWVFTILAILTIISRVYCGVHFPTDVLGSIVVGLVSNWIMRKFGWVLQPLTNYLLRLFKFGPQKSSRGRR